MRTKGSNYGGGVEIFLHLFEHGVRHNDNVLDSTHAAGGPCSRVCSLDPPLSAPSTAHVSEESPSNISPKPKELISKF